MKENIRKIQEIARRLDSLETQLGRIASFLEDCADREQVSDEMVRFFSAPVDELERRIKAMNQDVEYMKENN